MCLDKAIKFYFILIGINTFYSFMDLGVDTALQPFVNN